MTKNWDELCDEEKSFDDWFSAHSHQEGLLLDYLRAQFWNDEIINVLKTVYMQGYAAGFQSKVKYSSQEQLQK